MFSSGSFHLCLSGAQRTERQIKRAFVESGRRWIIEETKQPTQQPGLSISKKRNRSKKGKYARKQENARSNSPWSTAWWRSTDWSVTLAAHHYYEGGSTSGGGGLNFIIVKPCNSLLTMAFQSSISGTHRHYMQCFMVQTIFYTIVQCASFCNYNTNNLEEWFSFFVLANCNYAVGWYESFYIIDL